MDQKKFIIKGSLFVLLLIIIIVIMIIYSYRIWKKESFNTVINLTAQNQVDINNNKTYINDILRLMKQKYPFMDTNLSNYGLTDPNVDPNSPLKLDSDNLDSEFQLNFVQELQNREIANLEDWYNELNTRVQQYSSTKNKSSTITSVKHIPSGKLFGILKNPSQVDQRAISIIIDPKNATCIKKITPTVSDKGEIINNIDLTACDYNPIAPGQKFIIETVNNNKEFNNMLAPSEVGKYGVSENYGFGVYPFSVIKSADPSGSFGIHTPLPECITLDRNGLSIEPCNGTESQRFTPTDLSVALGV